MNTPRRRIRSDRSRVGRLAPRFDRLEARLALSTAGLPSVVVVLPPSDPGAAGSGGSGAPSVVSTDPPSGSTLAQAPASLAITFDRSIADKIASGDFRLDRVAPDGTETTIEEGSDLSEALGATAWQAVVSPGAPLGPGHYRLSLLRGSALAAPGGADRVIDDFTVVTPGGSVGHAIDLGSPVSVVATASGSLDLADDPGAADYYRVVLPRGHFWRLGAEVDAGRIGSPLLSSIAVYDAQGHAIATQDDWNPDDQNDPYVFVGLDPGVYYIGVSGRGDLPLGAAPSGGAFRLQVVADPADAATTVVSSSLVYADPTEDVPTGLTLRFSGPIDESRLAGNASDLIVLVDASGHAWSTDAVSYQAAGSTATFVFNQALPAGRYTVELAGQGGLVDLVGKPPIGPGLPAGALARFTVPSAVVGRGPGDYGPLFLDQAEDGLTATLRLKPGEEVIYRFVIICTGNYDLQTTFGGSAPTLTARVDGHSVSLDAGTAGAPRDHLVRLQPGVITLDVKGGPGGTVIGWLFGLNDGSYDLLLDNGVGQVSPLGLRLIAPTPLDLGAAPGAGGGLIAGPTAPGETGPASATPGPSAVPANPGGTFLAANAGLIGHPSIQDDAIAVVGPVAPGGMTALSSSVAGIPQGLSVGIGQRAIGPRGPTSGAIQGLLDVPESEGTSIASLEAGEVTTADLPPLPDAPAVEAGPRDVAQAPGLVDRVSALLAKMIPSRRRAPAHRAPADLDDAALADLGRDPRGDGAAVEEPVETADLSSPLGVAVIAVAAAHYHKRFGHWLGRSRTRAVSRGRGATPSGPRRPTD